MRRLGLLALLVLLLAAGAAASRPDRLRSFYKAAALQVTLLRHGIAVRRDVMVEMADGVRLATDLYLPPVPEGGLPALLVRLPYDKSTFEGALYWARAFAPLGYAVVLQDMRGRHRSEGVFAPYALSAEDGAATLDWIAAQPWSNGRVGTAGCSALGESQAILATTRNPHLRALVAEGAGGAIGTGGASRAYFGIYEGGVPNLAAAFGWFAFDGGKTPDRMAPPAFDPGPVLAELPSGTLVARHRGDPTDYEDVMARFEDDGYWAGLGYLTPDDRFAAPALHVDTWHDISVRGGFEVADLMRRGATTEAARAHQHLVVGPGLHCDFAGPFADGRVGDLPVDKGAALDLEAIYRAWFDHWLRDGPLPDLAPYTYFVLGANRWETSDRWPPPGAREARWPLGAGGTLSPDAAAPGAASFRYDPMRPTPSLGGPICCTGDPALRAGPIDQAPNAGRPDVLAFASAPLDAPLRLVGDMAAEISLSSDAPDTDLVAILVDVAPSGTMVAITQGALRLRYRDGFDAPRPLAPGEVARARVELRPIAYEIAAGHRLGLHLSSSSFPRLERNLNGPGPNAQATVARVATNTVHFGGPAGSALLLWVED